jgi:D-alanyl-D-alanine dipeptidase
MTTPRLNIIRCLRIAVLVALCVALHAQDKPADVPSPWKGLLGEYMLGDDTVCVLERAGTLVIEGKSGKHSVLREVDDRTFQVAGVLSDQAEVCKFNRLENGSASSVMIGSRLYKRIAYGGENGESFRIMPLRPLSLLRQEALKAVPPKESGSFLESDLVELARLDTTVRLDVRYATTNNFMGEKFYPQPRAFLQRPAAEALVRVQQALRKLGYSLLIHDAYRPWYVTKMFWDATPQAQKEFVADPAKGSRHNRGCAVDLSLFDLKTGRPVEMVSGYDEFSHHAYLDYAGGTSLQRWHRSLLRREMEAEGFKVFESEWWHFDYRDWRKYPIGTATFEDLR